MPPPRAARREEPTSLPIRSLPTSAQPHLLLETPGSSGEAEVCPFRPGSPPPELRAPRGRAPSGIRSKGATSFRFGRNYPEPGDVYLYFCESSSLTAHVFPAKAASRRLAALGRRQRALRELLGFDFVRDPAALPFPPAEADRRTGFAVFCLVGRARVFASAGGFAGSAPADGAGSADPAALSPR